MPVFSFSRASICVSMPLPPDWTARSSSSSLFAPSRMRPPSRSRNGGSSTMVASIFSLRSASVSSCSKSVCKYGARIPDSRSLTAGRLAAPCESAARSRQEAVPVIMRVMARSKSVISRRDKISSSRSMVFLTSSSTAVRRRVICAGLRSGRSIHARSRRPPMAVFVLSSTHRRLPRFSFARIVSVSSRFRRAARSSCMNLPAIYNSSARMCGSSFFCRSRSVVRSAPAAAMTHGIFARPSASGDCPNCAVTAAAHSAGSNCASVPMFTQVWKRSRRKSASAPSSAAVPPRRASDGRKLPSSFCASCMASAPETCVALNAPVDTSQKHRPYVPAAP